MIIKVITPTHMETKEKMILKKKKVGKRRNKTDVIQKGKGQQMSIVEN